MQTPEQPKKLPFSEEELLKYVASERQDSVGFDNDGDELLGAREKSLEYYKGEVNDLPKLKNRSQVVSTDVSDAIETVFPDLMEVYFGGDDIASFRPTGEEDVDKAEQESEAIQQILAEENPGFMNFSHVFKDALLTRTGVWRMFWKEPEYDTQTREVNPVELDLLRQQGAQIGAVEEKSPDLYEIELTVLKHPGMACYEPVPSEDFACARDAVHLRDATYSAHRARPRMQDLIAEGFDAAKVRALPPYDSADSEEIKDSRDFADEGDDDAVGMGDLARVEVVYHVIKLLDPESNELQYYSVITGDGESTLLHAEEIEYVPYAAVTPYLVPHRLFGRSVADMMIEIQKVKTNLVRMMLDSGLFALNQRMEVAEDKMGDYTISDLLNNIPGGPIRVRTNGAVTPVKGGALAFDVLGAMETIDVMGEKRTGIMRFGQGLKADTLHDTAKGALEQAALMMKRVRMIARLMGEAGVKDLVLGLHKIMRLHSTHAFRLRRKKQFIPLEPTEWADRQDMEIEIGIGSGGRQEKIEHRKILGDAMGSAIEYQEKVGGQTVTLENMHNYYEGLARDLGYKSPEKYFSAPKEGEEAQDPRLLQAQQAMEQMQARIQELESGHGMEMAKINQKAQADQYKINMDGQMKQMQMQMEGQLRQMQMRMEAALKRYGIEVEAETKANIQPVEFGGQVG